MDKDKLLEIIIRKRQLMGLKMENPESDVILSDMRHLMACCYFCNQHTKEGTPPEGLQDVIDITPQNLKSILNGEKSSSNTARFLNLEMLDQDEARTVQKAFECAHGMPNEKALCDILDRKPGYEAKIEVTVTGSDLRQAINRKKARQKECYVIAFNEDCTEVMATKPEYQRMAKDAMNALFGALETLGMRRRLNEEGSMKQESVVETPQIAEQWRRIIKAEIDKTTRDPDVAMKKIAKQDYHMSTKGAEPTRINNIEGEYFVWPAPWIRRSIQSRRVGDLPYQLQLKTTLDSIFQVETNKKPLEELLKSWILGRENSYMTREGELIFTDPANHVILGEKVKKTSKSFVEATESGDMMFLGHNQKEARRAIGVTQEAEDLLDFCLRASEGTVEAHIDRAYHLIQAQGTAKASIHRKTQSRVARPIVLDGDIYGFLFKGSSTAQDVEKQAHQFLVIFGEHPEDPSKGNKFYFHDGQIINWYIDKVGSMSSWTTSEICADKRLLWASEFDYDWDRKEPFLDPLRICIRMVPMKRALFWSQMLHLNQTYKSSAISEALCAMSRKMESCVRCKVDGEAYGALRGFGAMCEEVNDCVMKAHTLNDFCHAGICRAHSTFLSGGKVPVVVD
uniref:Putative polymerase acidic protein n=1 Tax=Pilchard orthomyxovirus TaxID=2732827 RepID=A0A6M4AM57_9ORTO|nr:putative polymerase acidic protein [Pilchard orthomyxovirus]